jgi:hypothetical protein
MSAAAVLNDCFGAAALALTGQERPVGQPGIEAPRGVLGTVRCKPVRDDGVPYLAAHFNGGDAALLAWLAVDSTASNDPISALVAGAC